MNEPLIAVNRVWKRLCRDPRKALRYAAMDMAMEIIGKPIGSTLREGEFWALKDVSLDIRAGEVLGIIGHNGAGKSTLINIISGLILPTIGSVRVNTERVVLLDQTGGFNADETGRENIITILAQHCIPANRLMREAEAVKNYAGIGDVFDSPVGSYSLGMKLRLAFSVYTRIKPDLFIIDEAIGGGDIEFQNRFRSFMRAYIDAGGSVLLCSHQLVDIQVLCDKCILLDHGDVASAGEPSMVIDQYLNIGKLKAIRNTNTNSEVAMVDKCERDGSVALGDCTLESISILGAINNTIRSGDAMVVDILIATEREVDGAALTIEIGRAELLSIASFAIGYPKDPLALTPPCVKISCRIERLPLAPGDYEMRIALSNPRSGVVIAWRGYEDNAIGFAVKPPLNHVSNLGKTRHNLVHIDATWKINDERK